MLIIGSLCLIISIGLLTLINRKKIHSHTEKAMNKTFAIIKPHAVKEGNADQIMEAIRSHGFDIIDSKHLKMTRAQAETFYAIHKERPFFGELVDTMTSGPVVVMVLGKKDAVKQWRDLMGSTDPLKAPEGTIRNMFGKNIGENAVHGSDSDENAVIEIKQFFPEVLNSSCCC